MEKKLTVVEIGKLAGVGKSTVSRYFNNGSISEEAKLKIQKVIEETNYLPNIFARGMKAKNNNLIGVIVPCFDSTTTSTILMNLDNTLRKNNYIPMIINTNHNIDLEIAGLENLKRLNVEGIAVISTKITPEHEKFVKTSKIPTIFVGQISKNGYSIVGDEKKAGKELANYIIKKDIKSVLYISVDENDVMVGIERKNAVLKTLEKSGISSDIIYSDFSYEKTEKLLEEIIKTGKLSKYDCIISATDNMAFGAINALQKNGVLIPDDIKIASFGGYRVSEIVVGGLTSIKYNYEQMGIEVANSLLSLISGISVRKKQKIDYIFFKRKSC